MTTEGSVAVPGAALRYRLVGNRSSLPVIVFENGWSASYDYWAWVQRELAPHAQTLFYNRAGIGGSTAEAPKSAKTVSDQFEAMLSALNIAAPVVVAGPSYGGLMCALHAAQKPRCVLGFVQLDATPSRDDPVINKTLKMTKAVTRVIMALSRVGRPDPIFKAAAKALPAADAEQLQKTALGSRTSMSNAFIELDLINDFRAAIARTPSE